MQCTELCQLKRVRRSQDTDSIKMLVHAFVKSSLDYFNADFAVSCRHITDVYEDQKRTTGFLLTTACIVGVNVFQTRFPSAM